MIKRKILDVKGTYYISLPHHLCDLIGIGKGSLMGIEYEKNKFLISPINQK